MSNSITVLNGTDGTVPAVIAGVGQAPHAAQPKGNQHGSWLYVFDVQSEPQLVRSHNLSKLGQDAHGAIVDGAMKML